MPACSVQVEAYYHSAAAGHARITLGNRRWGENGYVASGRLRARPVQNKPKGPTPSKVRCPGAAAAWYMQGTCRHAADMQHLVPAHITLCCLAENMSMV